jgi:hypothetical protein
MMKTLPLVAPQHEIVPYKLEESERIYEQMAEESIALIHNEYIEAPIALVRAFVLPRYVQWWNARQRRQSTSCG